MAAYLSLIRGFWEFKNVHKAAHDYEMTFRPMRGGHWRKSPKRKDNYDKILIIM